MAYKVTVIRDVKTGDLISRVVNKIDAVVNDRPLVEFILKSLEDGK